MSDDESRTLNALEAKAALRAAIRRSRRERSERQRIEAGQSLANVIDAIPQIASATCVAAYAARPGEPEAGVIVDRLADRGVRVLLPVLGARLARSWAEYIDHADLQVRAPGRPPEPSGPALCPETLSEADVILIPALAVDTRGVRLGQGGGWYDRALEHASPTATRIALVYPEEVYDAAVHPLPCEPHDCTVDLVATAIQWRSVGTRALRRTRA